mmetsp:Transcript_2334/g.7188  ORF Transcript_2334/g.7188 Transcript_2334/m.7188 type:complete len:309 (+) Transcript_2334:59-985(+)
MNCHLASFGSIRTQKSLFFTTDEPPSQPGDDRGIPSGAGRRTMTRKDEEQPPPEKKKTKKTIRVSFPSLLLFRTPLQLPVKVPQRVLAAVVPILREVVRQPPPPVQPPGILSLHVQPRVCQLPARGRLGPPLRPRQTSLRLKVRGAQKQQRQVHEPTRGVQQQQCNGRDGVGKGARPKVLGPAAARTTLPVFHSGLQHPGDPVRERDEAQHGGEQARREVQVLALLPVVVLVVVAIVEAPVLLPSFQQEGRVGGLRVTPPEPGRSQGQRRPDLARPERRVRDVLQGKRAPRRRGDRGSFSDDDSSHRR